MLGLNVDHIIFSWAEKLFIVAKMGVQRKACDLDQTQTRKNGQARKEPPCACGLNKWCTVLLFKKHNGRMPQTLRRR